MDDVGITAAGPLPAGERGRSPELAGRLAVAAPQGTMTAAGRLSGPGTRRPFPGRSLGGRVPYGAAGRRSRRGAAFALIGVVVFVVLVGIVTRVVTVATGGCSGGVQLRVAASPEIAPALEEVASAWMARSPEVNGVCVQVTVDNVLSSTVASRITVFAGRGIDIAAVAEPTPSESALPSVWIPDSSAWLTRVRAIDASAFVDAPQSVASSPVVLAVPEVAARLLGWPAKPLELAGLRSLLLGGPAGPAGAAGALGATGATGPAGSADAAASAGPGASAGSGGSGATAPRLRLGISEPRRETAGLAAAILLGDTIGSTDADLPALVQTLRGVVKTSSTGELLRTFSDKMNAGPASEQAVLAFDADNPPIRLAPVALNPAPAVLDYPFAIRAGAAQAVGQAAGLFRTALSQPSARAALTRLGFRTPDGQIGEGFPSDSARNLDPNTISIIDDTDRVERALGLWTAANSASRTLALFDVSASMATPMQTSAGPASRMQVMVTAARGGLGLFLADSKVGMWTFGAGHREVIPIGTLGTDQRADFEQGMRNARPAGSDQDDLYATLLAAYTAMKDGYDPARPNLIIVLTDGADSDRTALARARFNQSVQKLADPTRPIRVVLIGISADQDNAANLQTVAGIVGGGYFPLTSPEQIQGIFLKALLAVGSD